MTPAKCSLVIDFRYEKCSHCIHFNMCLGVCEENIKTQIEMNVVTTFVGLKSMSLLHLAGIMEVAGYTLAYFRDN